MLRSAANERLRLSPSGLTWVEVLVALAIVGILIALALPLVTGAFARPFPMLSNMRQLHLATQQMVMDGETIKDETLGWPGDTGGTFSNWTRELVPAYLGTNDLCKLLSAPGKLVYPPRLPLEMSESAVLVYAVSSNSPVTTVSFSSANFTNTPAGGILPLKTAKPFGDKKFIVMHKSGDGAVLRGNQVGQTNIGTYVPLLR